MWAQNGRVANGICTQDSGYNLVRTHNSTDCDETIIQFSAAAPTDTHTRRTTTNDDALDSLNDWMLQS